MTSTSEHLLIETDTGGSPSTTVTPVTGITAIAGVAPETRATKLRRFGFRVGQVRLLLAEGLYCELLTEQRVTPLPNSPEHVLGLLNLRGNIVPVYSLYGVLEQPPASSAYTYLIGSPENGAALVVDDKPSLIDLTHLTPSALDPHNVPTYLTTSIDDVYRIDNQQWLSVDHEELFYRLTLPA